MNYRHSFHAGNFADVMKHSLLVQLFRALQQKDKGFLYLDTHAGRGCYDLTRASEGDSRQRDPEWPDGVGRLWELTDLPAVLHDYVALVRQFDRERGNREAAPRFIPGSPCIARTLARPQDRLALCEKHPEEFAALSEEFQFALRAAVQDMDGYVALRALLPPPERRALVLIDPAFETQDESERILSALRDGLKRLPAGVFSVWYPLTERARVDAFKDGLLMLRVPPTLVIELAIAGEHVGLNMRGCGLAIINPPWKFEEHATEIVQTLARIMVQGEGAGSRVEWLVPET
jgi:23S rRNA (adenine2030-N6)-methyltransferase